MLPSKLRTISTPVCAYPAVDLHVNGAEVAVGSADVDELDQRPDADPLRREDRPHVRPSLDSDVGIVF